MNWQIVVRSSFPSLDLLFPVRGMDLDALVVVSQVVQKGGRGFQAIEYSRIPLLHSQLDDIPPSDVLPSSTLPHWHKISVYFSRAHNIWLNL